MGKAAAGVGLGREDQKFSFEHVMFEMSVRNPNGWFKKTLDITV